MYVYFLFYGFMGSFSIFSASDSNETRMTDEKQSNRVDSFDLAPYDGVIQSLSKGSHGETNPEPNQPMPMIDIAQKVCCKDQCG